VGCYHGCRTKLVCDFIISAVGGLTEPKYPNIKGIDSFKGKLIHTANWDHSYHLEGKKVAVIGTGASAIQVIPEMAKIVKQLTVFQRSAPYLIPRFNIKHSSLRKRMLKSFPFLQKITRFLIWAFYEYLLTPLFLGKGKMAKIYKRIFLSLLTKYRTLIIKDPTLLKKVTPDYEMGCKRALITSDYYPALTRENVDLIIDPIVKITETSIVTTNGDIYLVDAIIIGTGFDVQNACLNVVGLNCLNLKDFWKSIGGMEGYKGVTVSGYPNFFMTLGPNSGAGSMSVLYAIEAEISYIVKALHYARKNNISFMNAKKEVMDAFNYKIQKEMMPSTVWATGCQSWYKTEQGKVLFIWPGYSHEFAKIIKEFVPNDYELITK
jgi:cation diffusion facilitator CzcD-associated flavoprotein CzcO